ncbi:MAG: hypothetical protein CMP63_02055 [Flavobacteriales bacterium]|nr:hypothetical protein [Flavobacteriales bacterium]|tara:strand:+ start:2700 stop:3029 length:330 start_codon:yes stop_codon:yes gene_type:complete
MILFGRKDKLLATREIPEELCESCGERGGIVSIFQIYYHVAKIPFFPLSRRAASQCYSCRKVKVKKDFSNQQRMVSKLLKKETKTPLWTMIGSCLILICLVLNYLIRLI